MTPPTTPWTAGHWAASGRCALCAAAVFPDGFRDRTSYREFHTTGLCQDCQDGVHFRPSADARLRYPIRRGVLAAPAVRDGAVAELAVLPFVCIVPEARIEWEARWLLRAGAGLVPLDPWDELLPAEHALREHQVRLAEVDDAGGPEVRAALDADIVVVLDAPAERALAQLPLKDAALRLALTDGLPRATLDAHLAYWLQRPVSVVRACALMVLVLAHPTGSARRRSVPLRTLLEPHRARFPEFDLALPGEDR